MLYGRLVVLVALAGALALGTAGAANAGPYTADPLVVISGPSPFAACTVGGPGTNYVNSEVEPWVDVNPTDPDNIVAVYQQDRWSNGAAHGLVAAVTHDGGTNWGHTWAHFSTCSGGTAANHGDYERTSDPWNSFAPNGDLYQISISFNQSNPINSVLVAKSTDGGDTWSEPTTLIRDTDPHFFNDKESITADPLDANNVYAVWDRSRVPSERSSPESLIHSFAFRSDIYFARTTNAGASWEAARAIFHPLANEFAIGDQIAVLPDGTLLDVFALTQGSGIQKHSSAFVAVLRSTDGGDTWSAPIIVGDNNGVGVRDPETGIGLRTGSGLPDVAVDLNAASAGYGTVYVVWQAAQLSGKTNGSFNFDQILFSKSTDGGETWSAPAIVNKTPGGGPAFTPSVHVAADGTVGITYYDLRNNTPAAGLATDYFLIHSHNQGATWTETPVTPTSFDTEIAPIARGYFLGDYEGLASIGNAFVPVFMQGNAGNTANRTDGFETTVGP